MRIALIATLLLVGCSGTVPVTNTVSKRQDYVMPEELAQTLRVYGSANPYLPFPDKNKTAG